jgi:nucleoside-diphosphate-sugar epimerase
MKIAITGAKGTVGKEVVKLCASAGHHSVQIDRMDMEDDGTPNSETRKADISGSFEQTLNAFKGCDAVIHLAAIPNPVNKSDEDVHSNNVNASFNGFRAAGELGIKKICWASSVNAIGLSYSNQPLKFAYFPIDEEAPQNPTDSYALSKMEGEIQARAFVNWFPGTKIACMRIHEVLPRKEVAEEHAQYWEESGIRQLWGWVSPQATARACLLAVEKADNFEGCEIFNVHAPDTAQETSSEEFAKKYFPNVERRGTWSGNQAFWTTDKAKRVLGWEHYEKE